MQRSPARARVALAPAALALVTLVTLVTLTLAATPALAQHVIDQVTFPPGCGCQPELAVSLDHYVAVAYVTEQPGHPEPQIGVQMVPINPDTDEIWPEPAYFGPGSHHAICWSRDGFTLAFVGPEGDTVHVYQANHEGMWAWDAKELTIFQPGGEVAGLDLWGAPTDAAGHAVFLVIDDVDPGPGDGRRIHFASRSSDTGWTALQQVRDGLPASKGAQVTWATGPAGPWPQIFFLDDTPEGSELYRIYRDESGWTAPIHVPGDGGTGPTSFEWEFDVSRAARLAVVGLGPQPTCPCGTVHFVDQSWNTGWLPEENITVDHGHFDWPHSPRVDAGWDNVAHVFWYQRTSSEFMEPLDDALEYWTYDGDDVWTDRGAFLDHLVSGLGSRVDVGVTPDGERSVLAWSLTDTIAGEPQPEEIFLARSSDALAAPRGDLPAAAVSLAAWPNPFNPRVHLAVTSRVAGPLSLEVYDARGRLLRRLHDATLPAGRHEFTWDGLDVRGRRAPSGVYLARAASGSGSAACKLVLTE